MGMTGTGLKISNPRFIFFAVVVLALLVIGGWMLTQHNGDFQTNLSNREYTPEETVEPPADVLRSANYQLETQESSPAVEQ